uniref:Uncharacterized protein n=2 Tax=Chrysotila carterae TaxID=13221 RepID=A0A7S4B2W4_CHRCT
MSAALFALSIGRFLTEQLPRLPLTVSAKLLEEYDFLMLLVALLEKKPWEHRGADGTLRRFVQGQWLRVGEADARRMDKSEAQVEVRQSARHGCAFGEEVVVGVPRDGVKVV